MTSEEARAIEREYNALADTGIKLYEQIEDLAAQCNKILADLKEKNVGYDEIALLFGSELQIEE